MNLAIEIKNLTIKFGKKEIVTRANLQIAKGEVIAVLGESGSGKTSILRVIAGFLKPSSGQINLFGRDCTSALPEQRNVSMLFQSPVLFPKKTVRQNAEISYSPGSKFDRSKRYELLSHRIGRFAKAFQVNDFLDRRIEDGLSGGEKQRAALFKTFVNASDILLLDEPLKGTLNINLRWELINELVNHCRENQRTTLIVTHDFEEAAILADKIAVLSGNRLVVGSPSEMYSNPPNLSIAQVTGRGNKIDARHLRTTQGRENTWPLGFEGNQTEIHEETTTIFIRPNEIKISPGASEFCISELCFLGESVLTKLQALNKNVESPALWAQLPQSHKFKLGQFVQAKVSSSALLQYKSDGSRVLT